MSRKKSNIDKNILGDRIREIRKALSLTQQAFAVNLGISQAFLSEVEKGKSPPSSVLLIAICYRYSINEEWITEGQGEMFPRPEKNPCMVAESGIEYGHSSPLERQFQSIVREGNKEKLAALQAFLDLLAPLPKEKKD